MTFEELEDGSHFQIEGSKYIKLNNQQSGEKVVWGFRLGRKLSYVNAVSYKGNPAVFPREQVVHIENREVVCV